MQEFDKLENKTVLALLTWLRDERRRVNVSADGKQFATVVTGLHSHWGARVLTVDPAAGLRDALREAAADRPCFEFWDRDGLRHQFETRVVLDEPRRLYFAFPDHIRRYQLRSDFRIKAPHSAELLVHLEDQPVAMKIENISLGGVFCHCADAFRKLVALHPSLNDLQLVLTFQSPAALVPIAQAEMRRMTPPGPSGFGVAYKFAQISKDAHQQLKQQIYLLQREYLQNRLRIEK